MGMAACPDRRKEHHRAGAQEGKRPPRENIPGRMAMEQYLMYLRKSRKDRDLELQTGRFDTLQRHRDTLLALAHQQAYSVAHIYEEVVSGDTIAERPEMQKLLAAVESGAYAGVLVMEVPRLARGNTRDQGTVAETFQYSGTKIITPDKVYDPADEADAEYFEFGLFMSRREYKAINRRLQRGRMASLSEGKYIAGTAPYGYRRIRVPQQRGYTLAIVPETAEIVREIFHLYTVGEPRPDGTTAPIGSYGIANLLNARGVLSPGGTQWTASAVRDILKNPTYAGYLRWSYRPDKKQMTGGILTVSHPVNPDTPLQKGIHPPIISQHTWTAAKAAMARRAHAPVPGRRKLVNPLAGLLRCGVCGRTLVQLPQGSHGAPLLLCPTVKCPTVASRRDVVEQALLSALRQWLGDSALGPESFRALGQEDAAQLQSAKRQIAASRQGLDALRRQNARLYDFLEQGVYTRELFQERTQTLAGRILEAEVQLAKLEEHLSALQRAKAVLPAGPLPLGQILDTYALLETPAEKNALLKIILDHAVYIKTQGGQGRTSDLTLYLYPRLAGAEQS